MGIDYPGAIPPPPGEEADLEHPWHVLRLTNYVTQALTLVFVTVFVAIRLYARRSVFTGNWKMDDCEYHLYYEISSICVRWPLTPFRFNMLRLCTYDPSKIPCEFQRDLWDRRF